MTEDQLTRFEFFIRSHFSRNRVKEIITQALIARKGPSYAATAAGTVTEEIAIVSASLAKLFVGDLIETGSRHFYCTEKDLSNSSNNI